MGLDLVALVDLAGTSALPSSIAPGRSIFAVTLDLVLRLVLLTGPRILLSSDIGTLLVDLSGAPCARRTPSRRELSQESSQRCLQKRNGCCDPPGDGDQGSRWRSRFARSAQAFRSPELRRLQLAGIGSTLARLGLLDRDRRLRVPRGRREGGRASSSSSAGRSRPSSRRGSRSSPTASRGAGHALRRPLAGRPRRRHGRRRRRRQRRRSSSTRSRSSCR